MPKLSIKAIRYGRTGGRTDRPNLNIGKLRLNKKNFLNLDIDDDGDKREDSMKFNIVSGVLDRSRQHVFERMLWRVSKGNVFVR